MEEKRIIVKLGGGDVDFTHVPPLTGADRKWLFGQGIEFGKLSELDPEKEGILLLRLVQKVKPSATQEEVDGLPIGVQQSMLTHFFNSTKDASNPFRQPSSTSSPASTAGDKQS
jgi:hypothetical protein